MALASYLGKQRLRPGAPLLLLVRWEPQPGRDPLDIPQLALWAGRDTGFDPLEFRTLLQPRAIDSGLWSVEVDTDGWGVGTYRVSVASGQEHVETPEIIWLLDEKDYERAALEESKVRVEERESSLHHLIQRLERFVESEVHNIPGGVGQAREAWWSFSSELPDNEVRARSDWDRVRWTAEALIEVYRYVAATGGVAGQHWIAQARGGLLTIGFAASLARLPSDAALREVRGDLELLNASKDLQAFEAWVIPTPEANRLDVAVQQAVDMETEVSTMTVGAR